MVRLRRRLVMLAVFLLILTAAGAALPYFGLELLPPHAAKRSGAIMDDGLRRAVDEAIDGSPIKTVDDARDFALSATDGLFHFGLNHATNMRFSASEREANCIEYAALYAKIFDRVAERKKLSAKAFAVHSGKARLFGKAVPMRGFDDHDWVLIDDRSGAEPRRLYVDPTLHDAGLGWDVKGAVKGSVTLPRDQ